MIAYCINTVICSGYFIVIYLILLEREKMHRFNRFYLLFGLVLTLIVPLVTIQLQTAPVDVPDIIYSAGNTIKTTVSGKTILPPNERLLPRVLLICYSGVSVILLMKFMRNIYLLLSKALSVRSVLFQEARLVLLDNQQLPHSFLNYIFIDRNKFETGSIENEILTHELTHVRQKHSADIIVVELIKVFFWFNPFIYLYRRSILLNHEFLADDAVIASYQNINAYRKLLVAKAAQAGASFMTSSFNYMITKKRLTMMTHKTSALVEVTKKLAVLPLLAIAITFFSIEVSAQQPAKPKRDFYQLPSTAEGVSKELLAEYRAILNKYVAPGKNWWSGFDALTLDDRKRLEEIFMQMSKDQKDKQFVAFRKQGKPLPRIVPTADQLKTWQNENIYGVWIDGKRVANSVLSEYTGNQFSQAYVSKLAKIAKNYGKHYYQVDLMTNDYYAQYLENRKSVTGNDIMFRGLLFKNPAQN
jgi:bla regulator protein blaR1